MDDEDEEFNEYEEEVPQDAISSQLFDFNHLTEEERERHAMFRRSKFQKGAIKKAISNLTGFQVPVNIAVIVAGTAKVFISEMVQACHVIMLDWGINPKENAIAPEHLREAYRRHIGPGEADIVEMCKFVGVKDLASLVDKTLPDSIRLSKPTNLGIALSEHDTLARLKTIASENKTFRNFIGMGYYQTRVPTVILRNIMESPSWYTQYTPYQPEISQGRLESLLNFQTMVCDMTGLPIANASLLDEATAAAEAMLLSYSSSSSKKKKVWELFNKLKTFLIDANCHLQTIACVRTRAEGLGIKVEIINDLAIANEKDAFGVLIQYPDTKGSIHDFEAFVKLAHENSIIVSCATDLMALALLKPPGEFGVDIAFGNSQRFGVPIGFGGPHAAFFAVRDDLKRRMPGRLVGVSKDATGKKVYRLALQTREQHIRREKATSNICTAQALLANIAAMYAVYHGAEGIKSIAQSIQSYTSVLAHSLQALGFALEGSTYFDTITVALPFDASILIEEAEGRRINVRLSGKNHIGISLDETVSKKDLIDILNVFASAQSKASGGKKADIHVESIIDQVYSNLAPNSGIPEALIRKSSFLTHPVFNTYHSETEMLRYIVELQNKDLSLANAMIPLGSCTMKLNATTEMIPVTWPEFANIHPFAPSHQTKGYQQLIKELELSLGIVTGFDAVSLQPNSGAQGEYTGLRVIKAYLNSINQSHRDVCLIPVSAHGTNPASAAMSGLKVVTIKCLPNGNLDLTDLLSKVNDHRDNLAAIMITYPSTFGVFEGGVKEACKIVHDNGGLVYMDGANLNAQLGLCNPAEIGADVCHLNLHKTFCIPHGGGGPGVGPIGVKAYLAPFLPSHPIVSTGGTSPMGPVSGAPWGSASILPISWAYLKMMGDDGLREATEVALLSANYLMKKLEPHYKILYTNENGMCAHEFIIDIRVFNEAGVETIDVAKRLHDYGFHSPTMSFPVAGTLMCEPTESESKEELDRFVDAMVSIRKEIREVETGAVSKTDNVLVNSPHPADVLLKTEWNHPYSREQAAYPLAYLRKKKFWPSVSRVDDTYGDRNLICSCPPIESYEQE